MNRVLITFPFLNYNEEKVRMRKINPLFVNLFIKTYPKPGFKMKYRISIFLIFFCFAQQLKAQYFYDDNYYNNALIFEAGISIGPMNSLTDIGGRVGKGKGGVKDFNIKSTTLSGSIYFSAIYKSFLALRLEGALGRVQSNDSLIKNAKSSEGSIGRYNRNLSFRSPINEITLTAEFHPLDFFNVRNPEGYAATISPYVIAGIGYFHFKPQANLNGKWIDLQPLHTEGEGFAEYPNSKQYSLNQINVPLGIGVKYELSAKFNLRLEYITRVLNTDYLDDVHGTYIDPTVFSKYLSGVQLADALLLNNRGRSDADPLMTTTHPNGIRGNPNNNDSYFTVNVKVGFVIGREKINSWSRSQRRQQASPRFF